MKTVMRKMNESQLREARDKAISERKRLGEVGLKPLEFCEVEERIGRYATEFCKVAQRIAQNSQKLRRWAKQQNST